MNLFAIGAQPALPSLSGASASGAGASLIYGNHEAAKKAFLVALGIASSDGDRAAAARSYLRSTSDLTPADTQADPTLTPLRAFARSILARHRTLF